MAAERSSRKACCLVSEILEEAGLDREKARALRRQILQGIVLFCQWQLERMEQAKPAATRRKRAERVPLD
jgi:hypothetical protein